MWKVKHLFKRIRRMDFKGFFETVGLVAKRSKKLRIVIFVDMVYVALKYGAGYSEYYAYEFETLNKEDRSKFVTLRSGHEYYEHFNKKEDIDLLEDKTQFIEAFPEFAKRNTLDLREVDKKTFAEFIKEHPIVMVKKIDDYVANGIEKLDLTNEDNLDKVYDELMDKEQFLIEEYLIQIKEVHELHPDSLNTVRVITFLREDGTVAIINVAMKVGNGEPVDNMARGGLYGIVNEEGIVPWPFMDKYSDIHVNHPLTNKPLMGFKLPKYEEVIEIAVEMAKKVPTLRYVGWDVAILDDRVLILEGNVLPSLFQAIPSATRFVNEPIHNLRAIYDKEMSF